MHLNYQLSPRVSVDRLYLATILNAKFNLSSAIAENQINFEKIIIFDYFRHQVSVPRLSYKKS